MRVSLERVGLESRVHSLSPLSLAAFVLTLVFTTTFAHAQDPAAVTPNAPIAAANDAGGFQLSVGMVAGKPWNEVGEAVGWVGGVGAEFSYALRRAPLVIGVETQFQQMSNVSTTGTVIGVEPPVVVERALANASFAFYALTRFQQRRGTVRPYIDGVIGANYICARCSGGEGVAAVAKTMALGFGGGGGATVALFRSSSNSDRFALDLRVRYMHASTADYLTNDLTVVSARSHMLQMYIGILVY